MPLFRVRLSGVGINVSSDDGSDPLIGFFTTQQVRATDIVAAEERAKAIILAEWTTGDYARSNSGGVPTLCVEEAWPVQWFRQLIERAPKGYTFYCRD